MSAVVIVSYLSSVAAYGLLALLLASSWRGQRVGGVLIIAAIVSALWSFFLAYVAWKGTIATAWVFVADALHYGAWLGFLTALLASRNTPKWLRGINGAAHVPWILLALYCTLSATGAFGVLAVPFFLVVPIVGMLVLALCGLMLLEQLYRNVDPRKKWSLKFLVIALGTIFAYDIFLYSYAALYGHIDASAWVARGFINALVVPLLLVAAARNKQWAVPVAISRKAVFYSSSLFAVTLYIVAASAGGYLVHLYGGDWGRVAAITFGCLSALLLLMLVFSGQARARFRLFLYKNFFTFRYDYREEWLRLTATLAGGGADLPSRAIQAVAAIMDSPGGALFVRGESGDFVAEDEWNLPVAADCRVREDLPLFGFMRQRQWIYDLTEEPPLGDAELSAPEVLRQVPRAWLMLPLMVDEELIGFILLAQARARKRLNWEDIDLLRTAGRQVASTLSQAANARRLAETQQFEGFNRLTSFMMHDLKNLAAQQTLMLKNAERHKHNPAFVEDMIATTENALQRTNRILEQLRGERPVEVRSRVRLLSVLDKAVTTCVAIDPRPVLKVPTGDAFVQADSEQLAAVIGHVIRNAQEATPADGLVEVRLQVGDREASIEVCDSGRGMDQEFIRTQLFKPFFTTKGSKGMGIGAYQARTYVQSLGGRVSVVSAVGRGTTVSLSLPLDEPRGDCYNVQVEEARGG